MKFYTSSVLFLTASLLCSSAQGLTWPNCDDGTLADNDVCNTDLPPSNRAAALVKAMNMNEKLRNFVK